MRKPLALVSVSAAAVLCFLAIALNTTRRALRAADDDIPDPLKQPDYRAFAKIAIGSDESDVIGLIGQPIAKPYSEQFNRNTDVIYTWEYGHLFDECRPFPKPPGFRVLFHRGQVFSVEDPFQRKFSKDGSPTAPQPLWPDQPPTYHFYPRYIDFRWTASSGDYPMRYDIEVGAYLGGDQSDDANWQTTTLNSDIPYVAHEFVGDQLGRWRVRGVNSKGNSKWSSYKNFTFDNGPNSTHVGRPR